MLSLASDNSAYIYLRSAETSFSSWGFFLIEVTFEVVVVGFGLVVPTPPNAPVAFGLIYVGAPLGLALPTLFPPKI